MASVAPVVLQAVPATSEQPLAAPLADVAEPQQSVPVVVEPVRAPVLLVDLPAPTAPAAPSLAADMQAQTLRPVDVEQIAESEVRSVHLAQLDAPGFAFDNPTLVALVDTMQVTLPPPPQLAEEERAALLAEAPTELTVRIGDTALGEVAFRMTETNTVDIQLAGLLDLLIDRFDSSEFERLRSSAAADSFVGFDQLRALGLNLRYDPVYDELRISG